MYEQRSAPSAERFAAQDTVWLLGALKEMEPHPQDDYVVVDERIEGWLTLAVSLWPGVDRDGRLVFAEASRALYVDESQFQAAVNEARRRHRRRAATRPIRIGDAFLARGLSTDPVQFEQLVDVTREARQAAKVAYYSAVAPVTMEFDQAEPISEAEQRPPSASGSVAGPAV